MRAAEAAGVLREGELLQALQCVPKPDHAEAKVFEGDDKMNMIERVARALAQEEGARAHEVADFAEWHWEEFIDHARAVITAIREPTRAMIDKGYLQMPVENRFWQHDGMMHAEALARKDCVPPENVYRAMIDEALR